MKIVQVCPYDMTRPGGVQAHVRDLSRWLDAAGHETRIVAPPTPGRRAVEDGALIEAGRAFAVKLHGTGFEISHAAPWRIAALARRLRDWGADLVHLHTPWTPFLATQLWRALPLPAVVTLHATLPEAEGAGLVDRYIRRAARRILARADAVVVPSEAPMAMLDRLGAEGPAPVILPPSVDLSPWRDAARAVSGAPDAPLSLVFLGRLEDRKGVDVLLDAWRHVAPQLPGATLQIAGDGPMRAAVRTAAADPALRLSYAGRPDDAAARALVASADLFLAPAPYGESFGIVLIEAMSAGVLPVAAANPGYASVLTGPGTDLLAEPGDTQALARRILSLAQDADLRARLAGWARPHAESYDIAATGPAFVDLYEKALSKRRG